MLWMFWKNGIKVIVSWLMSRTRRLNSKQGKTWEKGKWAHLANILQTETFTYTDCTSGKKEK